MRVLHVMATAETGGGARHLVSLAKGLKARGIESAAAFGRDGPAATGLRSLGAEVRILGTLRWTGSLRLARLFRELPADLVHLHGSRAGFLGALAARDGRVAPIVYTAHAFSFNRRLPPFVLALAAKAERLTCSTARRVICLSQADRDRAARLGIDVARFVLIPNGIEMGLFDHPRSRRGELGWPTEPIVGTIGRLVPGKDPLRFVDLANEVAREIPEARFLVVGDGPLRREMETAARAAGLGERLRITGFRDDVPELLATLDVVVFPSLWEGMPLAVLEAMAAARPIVATAIEGHRALLDDGRALLVPVKDSRAMARAVASLLRDRTRAERLGQEAREHVRERFTVDRMVESTADVYRQALAG